jgi:catechol 2,3-dioxygenase-like lactoylglutathione lyase family enzyme
MSDAAQTAVAPAVRVNFIYGHCHDVAAMRHFYSDLLGLTESSYRNDDEWQWLVYECGCFQLMFFPDPGFAPPSGWCMQPGWDGGTVPGTSWSVTVPMEQYAATVHRLRASGVTSFTPHPTWQQGSYWSFPVKDPAGNTVELCGEPGEQMESREW